MEEGITVDSLSPLENREGYEIALSDGSRLRVIAPFSRELEEFLPDVSIEDCRRLHRQSECYLRGLSLLSRREHSSMQLTAKLLQRGFSHNEINPVLHILKQEDSLSDMRFAEQWISQRVSTHPEGPYPLIAGLRRRGIDAKLASSVVNSYFDEENRLKQVCLTYLLKLNRNNTPIDELVKKAKKRGFANNILEACIAEFYTYTGIEYSVEK